MSVTIIGGNERMIARYRDICALCGYKSKVFCYYESDMSKKIGKTDLVVLFTATASHKMVAVAVNEAKRKSFDVVRCHSSSASALKKILTDYNKEKGL